MTAATRDLVEALVAARNAGSSERVRALVAPDATHWDCLSGRVRGAERVADALVASQAPGARPRFVIETLAAGERHAVVELRVSEAAERKRPGYPATEVYELREGRIAACRTYLDPADVRRG